MKITQLQIENFLGIRMLKFDRAGKINFVTGDNGVGKSSVLKAIKEAFSITSAKDPHIVHTGKDKAGILIRLDGDIEIERRFTGSGATLKVTEGDRPISKPQSFLNELFGPNIFNPIAFFQAKPDERRSLLLSAIDIKLTEKQLEEYLGHLTSLAQLTRYNFDRHGLELVDQLRTDIYNERAEVNRDVTRIKKAIEQDKREFPETFDPDKFEGFNFDEKLEAYEAARQSVTDHEAKKDRLESRRKRYEDIQVEIDELKKRIEKLEAEAAEVREEGKTLRQEIDSFELPPLEEIRAELDEFQKSQKLIVKTDSIREREIELEKIVDIHSGLDELHELLVHAVPKKMLASSKVPIEGLEIREDDVYVNDVPFEKLSQSEQIRFGVKLARFLSRDKKLKVILVDGIESLSTRNRKTFIAEASDDEFEYFITQVTEGELKIEAGKAS